MTIATRTIQILILISTVAAAAATNAEAVTQSDYAVTIEGQASYAHSESGPVVQGRWDRQKQAGFKWRAQFPTVSFIGKRLGTTAPATTTVSAISGKYNETIPRPDGPPMTGECTGDSLSRPASTALLGGSITPDLDPSTEDLAVRLIGGVDVALPSCSGMLGAGQQVTIDGGNQPLGLGPLDALIDLPREAIDMGKIIELLEGTATGPQCPGYGVNTVSCTLSWKATVTFVRIAQYELALEPAPLPPPTYDDDLIVPLPTRTYDDDLIVPLPSGKLNARAEQVKLGLTCSAACSGSATAYPVGGGAKASGLRPLARARFSGTPGRKTTVTLRFRPQARRQIKRAGGVRVTLRISPRAGGKEVRRSLVLRLRAASRTLGRSRDRR